MKGLLLKDFLMVKKYCKSYLLIVALFIAASFVDNDNLFFVFYPCLLSGMIPVNLLGYDERSKWNQYSATLPYTKAQIVSVKYLICLFAQVLVLLLSGIAQAVSMHMNGTFALTDYLVLTGMLLILSTVSSSIALPFMFKLGVEKGRMAYYVAFGVACAGSFIASDLFRATLQAQITFDSSLPFLCIAGIAIYALSWYLSIAFYKKREIQ